MHNTATLDPWTARKQILTLSDGRTLAFIDTGGRHPPLLLLHGFTDSSRSFEPLVPVLENHRLILPDLRGHGSSSGAAGWALADFANDLEILIDHLQLPNLSIIGHSMGAMTALQLASGRQKQIKSLVLLSGSLRPHFPQAIRDAIAALTDPVDPESLFLRDWHACATPVDPQFLFEMRCGAARMPAARWQAILAELQRTDLAGLARDLTIPALCIGGSLDPLFDRTHLSTLGAILPKGRTVLLQGNGHNPHWEDPQAIADLITAFLAGNA